MNPNKIIRLMVHYNLWFIILLFLLFSLLLFIKKSHYYENIIQSMGDNKAIMIVDKKYINLIKNKKNIIIKDLEVDYNIEKIEENENNYLLYIQFEMEIVFNDISKYKVFLEKESILEYFIRIIKEDK